MTPDLDVTISKRIDRIKELTRVSNGGHEYFQAASLAQSVAHDTVGGGHPIMRALEEALKAANPMRARGTSKALVAMYEVGALTSPRIAIAHEIEGELLDISEAQVKSTELNNDPILRQVQVGIAAFLAGAALEDGLRRLCDFHGVEYDSRQTSISKLQNSLYQPTKNIEVISRSEYKQITAWGETRNSADHGKFGELTQTSVVSMVSGVRALLDKHLP